MNGNREKVLAHSSLITVWCPFLKRMAVSGVDRRKAILGAFRFL
jgi:hypothetical protein